MVDLSKAVSHKRYKIDVASIREEYEVVCSLSNDAIFNDLG